MVEFAPQGGKLYAMNFAGDTFNTAWYARKLLPRDWSVAYGTCVGDDAVSDEMLAFMEGAGIDTSGIRRLGHQTVGLYVIELQHGERSFTYWRGQSAARRLADDPDWLDAHLAQADAAIFSAITLAILTPEARARLCDALGRARSAGTLVAFDTNMRRRLWSGEDEMRAGVMQGASAADVVLPSFDEESGLFGDASPDDTIARYKGAGARIVAVKNGPDPLRLWDGEGGSRWVAAAPVASVVDTTAAGDAFDAGLLSALLQGRSLDRAAAQATALAALVIGGKGALVDVDLDALPPSGKEVT